MARGRNEFGTTGRNGVLNNIISSKPNIYANNLIEYLSPILLSQPEPV